MMNYGIRQFVRLKGLNRRTIAVDRSNVLFLQENEIDGTIVTNVHFSNGQWVTAGLTLDEAWAMLQEPRKDADAVETALEEEQVARWKKTAMARAKAQKEVNEALALIGPSLKAKSYTSEVMPDGSGRMVILYEPSETTEKETQ